MGGVLLLLLEGEINPRRVYNGPAEKYESESESISVGATSMVAQARALAHAGVI